MTAEILAQLHPPRLPETFAAPGWDDFLAAAGVGLLLAALLLTLAAPALRRRARVPSLRQRAAAVAHLPPAERALALTRLLAQTGGTMPADLRQGLYAGTVDPLAIERLILAGPSAGKGQGHRR